MGASLFQALINEVLFYIDFSVHVPIWKKWSFEGRQFFFKRINLILITVKLKTNFNIFTISFYSVNNWIKLIEFTVFLYLKAHKHKHKKLLSKICSKRN